MADNSGVRTFFEKQGPSNPLVRRFIAGTSLSDGLLVVKEYSAHNISCSLDILGENVLLPEEAEKSTLGYLEAIRQISIFSPRTYLSVKLTALGMDISDQLARQNLRRLTDEARLRGGIFVRIDMEGSAYTARTHQIVAEEHRAYANVGGVVQSCLRRSDRDLESLIAENVSVRLVKGAYEESPDIAYPKKADIDVAFRRQMYQLLEKGFHPALATHDEAIINIAKKFVKQHNIDPENFEFEMLHGIRNDLQTALVKEGFAVRVYVPYGVAWYPYFSRRLAERPANVGSLPKNLFK